ncbi:hypothetical protein PHJA_002451400 [Phtheirospermum japonicum]|uniref:Uncharacterized protein n=1 Tax=Phtheirospermum japonicum TaxID=374723 RepID=A0A830D7G2_9LAMI|nr:hypothetical protein PHJA_002451400 [Phtheirospermum japonicum]
MATRKEAAPPQDRAVVEEEQVEKELDGEELSRLCSQHCGGVPATPGANNRRSGEVCATADYEDGSGDASTAGKCGNINQQADHYKCAD